MLEGYNDYPDEIHFIGNAVIKIHRQTDNSDVERKRLWKNMNDILNRELNKYVKTNLRVSDMCKEYIVDTYDLNYELSKEFENIDNVSYKTGSLGGEIRIRFTDRPEMLSIHFSESEKNSLLPLLTEKINYFFSSYGL